MDAGKLVNQISTELHTRSCRTGKKLGVTQMQGRILSFILVESRERPLYQKEIEREFGLRPSTVTELLNNLERRDMIRRVSSESDGRYKEILFTESAEQIRQALETEINKTEEVLTEGISAEDLECFKRVAGKMLENLRNKPL